MTAPAKPLPTYVQLGAGAFAGVVELACLYPLDVVKTRLQLQSHTAAGPQYGGVADTLIRIVREEGPARLYRGIPPLLLLEAPKRAIKFGANDFWGKTFRSLFHAKEKTLALSVLTGCAAGASESLIVVPFELVKIRLQDHRQTGRYRGQLDVVRSIVAAKGWTGMFSGLPATMLRHVLWNGGYFGSIFWAGNVLPKATTKPEQLTNSLIAGSLGGFVGTVLNTPADVVKTRIQNTDHVPGVRPKYHGTVSGMLLILREEGPAALYKGFMPKVLRLAPGGGILLLVVNAVLDEARHWYGPPYE
ncbi:hypothetical protein MSPP1_000522 [Malassezia sp. CBS 17886]|nr:hypothetical protein MSPP1_000522 [Malassezia sp. CBS 17886]